MYDDLKENLKYVNKNCKNIKKVLIDVFLKNSDSVVALDSGYFITYTSFLNNVINGSNMEISLDELAMCKKNKEYNNDEWDSISINLNRWKYLYSNNDKIIDYIRNLRPKKVYIMGELSLDLYNYINVYGNEFDTCIIETSYDNYIKIMNEENSLIVDTDNTSSELKNELFRNYRLKNSSNSKVMNINELCNNAELYYFVNIFLKNTSFATIIFEFPDKSQFEKLTFTEQLRMKSQINYIYYLSNYKNDPEIKKLVQTVIGDLFTEDYINKQDLSPGTILKNGICRLSDSNNDFCKTINGIRYTTDKNFDYSFDINLFGPCMVYGALVDDKHTIASFLQRKINQENMDYSVNNYGLRAMELPEQIRIADSINIKYGDKMIFIISTEEKNKLRELGYNGVISLLPIFNESSLSNYFLDKPEHCNHIANLAISNYIYNKIESQLNFRQEKNKKIAIPVKLNKKRNVFQNNKYVSEYLNMLKQLDIPDGPNGAILMNCNPFTYGHYNLINYASKQVNKLFVIVVQDDKSYFKFDDRFKMVVNGCKDFDNVTVIPSGKIFGSSMIFPEYFNREEKTDVSIDVSLDREIFVDYIAPILKVKKRFVGEEKNDLITSSYNRELKNNLPLYGIDVIEVARFSDNNGNAISAKTVRQALENNDWEKVSQLVPSSTFDILLEYKRCKQKKLKK